MGTVVREILEVDFKRKNFNKYDLSVLVGMDSFVLSFKDENDNFLGFQMWEFDKIDLQQKQLENLLLKVLENQKGLFHQNFRTIRFGFYSPIYTLVPNRLFKEEEKKSYLENICDLEKHQIVFANSILTLNAQIVFSIEKRILDLLNGYLPQAECHQILEAFIEWTTAIALLKPGKKVFLHYHGGYLDTLYFDDGNLVFCNSNPVETTKDILYFSLLVFQQFRLSQEEHPCFLSGRFLENSEIHLQLKRYIQNCSFLPSPDSLKFGGKMMEESAHLYAEILAFSAFQK